MAARPIITPAMPVVGAAVRDIGRPRDVAVADDGNAHGLGDLGDDLPVGQAGVALRLGASVHGHARDCRNPPAGGPRSGR